MTPAGERPWPADLPPLNVLGVMSGTSLDGMDAVLARLERSGGALRWSVEARAEAAFDDALRARLLRSIEPGGADVVELTQLHAEVGEAYAELCARVAASYPVDLVALSGQTVYHIPRTDEARGWRSVATLQLGEPTRVVERCGLPVVSDFRQSDLAAGGQGAPMVPFGDLHLFGERGIRRAVHNLGGIGNVTVLPADGDPAAVSAFDTGPANCLLDEAVAATTGGSFDEGGALAAAGRVDEALLARLLRHPYLRLPPPKTTGREVFNLRELFPDGVAAWSPADLLATLTAFTAETTADAYRRWVLPGGLDEALLAGGGALNPTLVGMLRARLPGVRMRTFEELGWRSKDRETLAFALMGYAAWFGLPNTLPSATGARRAVVAGRIARP
ncbi:MAG: anhydro-N-acetylmuramic acid kinase [Trueperaceae bacterium]